MPQSKPVKICLVGQSYAFGGAEKAMGKLSFFLGSQGFDVHNVIVLDEIAYPFSGKLFNMGKLKSPSNNVFDKAYRFWQLKKFLSAEKFDYIIDFRVRVSFLQEFFIRKLLYDAPAFYTVHSSILDIYFPNSRWQARAVYASADGIVAVSNGVKKSIERAFGLGNVSVIPNAIDLDDIAQKSNEQIAFEGKFIVAAGRMDDDVKQFGKLIETYSKSELPAKGIRLVILGDGKLREKIALNAPKDVIFRGFERNPYAWFSKAELFVLSSKKEGLPMVILESLASGTPVVSFDCQSGPNEMIVHEKNGLLVQDQDWDELQIAMTRMIDDEVLHQYCKSNSKAGANRFSLENVGKQWLKYLKIPVS